MSILSRKSAIFRFENSRNPLDLSSVTDAFVQWFRSHSNQALDEWLILIA
jgi:hypothetical protein